MTYTYTLHNGFSDHQPTAPLVYPTYVPTWTDRV